MQTDTFQDTAGIATWLLANPAMIFLCVFALFALSSLGAIVGLITRKIVILAAIISLLILFFVLHDYLPLPDNIHRQIETALHNIGL